MFSGSLVAIVTPMRPDGAVDLEAWARLLEFHLANGTNGIVIGGTTGESATLREAELRELTQRACAQLRGRVAVIAGAAAAARKPVLLYNVPARTAVDMKASTVARLSKVAGIVGVKEAVPEAPRVRELLDS